MKHFRFFIIIASILPLIGFSQGVNSLKINEILVINDSNYIDDFGERNGWIEIFNANYNYCLLYTSDAADDLLCVDLGGRRIIKKKTIH